MLFSFGKNGGKFFHEEKRTDWEENRHIKIKDSCDYRTEEDFFIRQIETCRDIIGFVRQIARDYFTDYADETAVPDTQDKAEAQFRELLSSGQLYKLAGLPDLPAFRKAKTEQEKEDVS